MVHYPDCSLCALYHVILKEQTKARLLGDGPQGAFCEYVESVLSSCGSDFTVGGEEKDPSLTWGPGLIDILESYLYS